MAKICCQWFSLRWQYWRHLPFAVSNCEGWVWGSYSIINDLVFITHYYFGFIFSTLLINFLETLKGTKQFSIFSSQNDQTRYETGKIYDRASGKYVRSCPMTECYFHPQNVAQKLCEWKPELTGTRTS